MVKIIQDKAKRRRMRRRVTKRIWDFGLVWEAKIYSGTTGQDGQTPMEIFTGDTMDISEWTQFDFYYLCLY